MQRLMLLAIAGSVAAMQVDTRRHVGLRELEQALDKHTATQEGKERVAEILQDAEAKRALESLQDGQLRASIERMLEKPQMQVSIQQAMATNSVVDFFVNLLKNGSAMRSGLQVAASPETREDIQHLMDGDLTPAASQRLFKDAKAWKFVNEVKHDEKLMQALEGNALPEEIREPEELDEASDESDMEDDEDEDPNNRYGFD